MKICAKEARRLKSKIEFRRLMEKMKKRFWTSWRSTKSTDIWRSGGGFGRRICKVGKGAQVENLLFYLVFLRKRRRWAFPLIYTNTLHAWDPPTFRGFFGLIFPMKRTFEPTILLLKKAARCHPFLAVVRCLFHNHLRLKRSSLLNVYLNYKFEISLLTSHLFFSLFNARVQKLI